MTYNTNHLVALMTRLSNETSRHADNPEMKSYLDGIKREIKGEEDLLSKHGVNTYASCDDMSMDEIMAELEM